MTVCRYFLQGTCRFGDRCRFEHPDQSNRNYDYEDSSRSSNRKHNYGYDDRYRQQNDNYQSRQNSYEDPDLSYGPRRYDNYESRDQSYSSNKYDQQEQYNRHSKGITRQHDSNDGYSSPERYSSNTNSDNYSNKYNRSNYAWVSEDYKRRQQPQQGKSLNESFIDKSTPKHEVSFSFKDSNSEVNSGTDEKLLILADVIKEDITAWELGNQWPFTCYFPFPKNNGFPVFKDVSFEELRYEALKAQENNTFDSFVQEIQKAVYDVNVSRNKLKQPTSELFSLIKKLRAGEHLEDDLQAHGGFSFLNQKQVDSESIFQDSSVISSQNTAAAFNLKSVFNPDTSVSSASSFSFKQPTVPSNSSASSFSFKQTDVSSASVFSFKQPAENSASTFSFKQPTNEKTSGSSFGSASVSDSSIYTALELLCVEDKEQFSASTFNLGKIPTVPPPRMLCF